MYFNHITYEGRGPVGPDHQSIDHNSKTALSSTSKLLSSVFIHFTHVLENFSKIDSPGGVSAVVFEMRCLEKLNI